MAGPISRNQSQRSVGSTTAPRSSTAGVKPSKPGSAVGKAGSRSGSYARGNAKTLGASASQPDLGFRAHGVPAARVGYNASTDPAPEDIYDIGVHLPIKAKIAMLQRPSSQISAAYRIRMKDEQIANIECRNSLVPPYIRVDLTKKGAPKQPYTTSFVAVKNLQSDMEYGGEQIDMAGRVRGKPTRLLANGTVISMEQDTSADVRYNTTLKHKYVPSDLRQGTPLRIRARAADPSRPMFNNRGYVMSHNSYEHPYFLSPPTEEIDLKSYPPDHPLYVPPKVRTPMPATPESSVPSVRSFTANATPGISGRSVGDSWEKMENNNAHLRKTRSYWQKQGWPGFYYQQR